MYSAVDLETTVLTCDNYFNFYLETVVQVVNSICIQ
jgi:hypothetical protein